jgi:hypothetical protein
MGFGKFQTKKTATVTHNRSEQPSTKMSNEQTRNTNTRSVWQWMWRDRQNETRERELCKNRTDTHTHTEWKKSERVKWRRPLLARSSSAHSTDLCEAGSSSSQSGNSFPLMKGHRPAQQPIPSKKLFRKFWRAGPAFSRNFCPSNENSKLGRSSAYTFQTSKTGQDIRSLIYLQKNLFVLKFSVIASNQISGTKGTQCEFAEKKTVIDFSFLFFFSSEEILFFVKLHTEWMAPDADPFSSLWLSSTNLETKVVRLLLLNNSFILVQST